MTQWKSSSNVSPQRTVVLGVAEGLACYPVIFVRIELSTRQARYVRRGTPAALDLIYGDAPVGARPLSRISTRI